MGAEAVAWIVLGLLGLVLLIALIVIGFSMRHERWRRIRIGFFIDRNGEE